MGMGDGMGAEAHQSTFGTYVDSDLAYLFGEAIGTRLAAGRLVIGGDGQPGSAAVREALRSGAVRTGCTVYDIGTVPTPALYFAKDRLWADGAAMITGTERASGGHLALSLGKLPATDLDLAEIEQAVEQRGPFAVGRGQLIRSDIAEPYRSFLVAHFVPAQPLPVVIASEEGNALRIAEETLRLVGYPVIRCPLPSSAGSAAVPTPLSPVDALCGAVVEHDGHLGAFYTGNGSRVVLVDETGTVLAPPQVLALLARALLRFEPGSQVVYDARLGTGVSREIRRIGGEPTSVGPGPSGVKRLVLERGAVLGADAEGGYCFRTMGTEDALYTTLVMLRIASHVGGALRPTLDRLDL